MAHALAAGSGVIKKGTMLTAAHIEKLHRAGHNDIIVARLSPSDVLENDAASYFGHVLKGAHVEARPPFTGRMNLHAATAGLLVLDENAIHHFNASDESITVATLAPYSVVAAGDMVATIKIIPFSILRDLMEKVGQSAQSAVSVAAFSPKRIAVVSTLLPHLKPATITKTLRVLEGRLGVSQSRICADIRVAHETSVLADSLRALATDNLDCVIVFGASAVTDRQDVIPAAIEAAGGTVAHVGMPVDPGNLLVLGALRGVPVIGAPGCARSARENGFDWVLNRLIADIPVTSRDIMRMGVGGLLKEIGTRPQPRDGRAE
ncbi:MAG: molybdopterin-binding protein [Beijerinckiaceae bacterium]